MRLKNRSLPIGLYTVLKMTGFSVILLILSSASAAANDADACLQEKSFAASIYGEFLYIGDQPRVYRVCVFRELKRVAAFVQVGNEQMEFPKSDDEQVCLDVEGSTIQVVSRTRRYHRGTYACLSCCDKHIN